MNLAKLEFIRRTDPRLFQAIVKAQIRKGQTAGTEVKRPSPFSIHNALKT